MFPFSSPHVRSRSDDVREQARRTLDATNSAFGNADGAPRALDDINMLLHSLEDAICALAGEGSAEADRARLSLSARADRLRCLANERIHDAQERLDSAIDHTGQRIGDAPFKAVGIALAVGAAIGLVIALSGIVGSAVADGESRT